MSEPSRTSDRAARRLTPDSVPPELRESYERRKAERRTSEYQEALARDIDAIRREFPPKSAPAPAELVEALARLRGERERLGLTLADVQDRTGMDQTTISLLESGAVPNPTVSTLSAYALALGKRLVWSLEEVES